MKKYRISLISMLLFAVVLLMAYLWHLFTEQDVPYQMLSALLGAAITVVITNLLLNSQTESEFDKQRMSTVYAEKLHIYQQYLQLLCDIVKDHLLSDDEMVKLQYYSSQVALHTSAENYLKIMEETRIIINNECKVEGASDKNTTEHLLVIVQCFHLELYGKTAKSSKEPTMDKVLKEFELISDGSTTYNSNGSVGQNPSGYNVSQSFDWKSKCAEWENLDWHKDNGNAGCDYLRFFRGKPTDDIWVEVRYDLMYGYILRAQCPGNLKAVKMLQDMYGGYRSGSQWWRVLESPFDTFKPCELMERFDTEPKIKERVYWWFNNVMDKIELSDKK